MATNILMPALSPAMTEGTLARWLKQEGDAVKSGDVIAEIETDKATMEVEAVDEGTLAKILVPAGTEGVKVNAVIYFRVLDPVKAILEIEDYLFATSQLSQTTLRSVCGGVEMDDLLTHRDEINTRIQAILDTATDPWGIKVTAVELKHIDLPQEMQRAMARQAEAERERRAKVIAAEGEFQAAEKLAQAAEIIGQHPQALQLRYLQTLTAIAGEKSSTIVFPMPMDLLSSIVGRAGASAGQGERSAASA